MATRRLEERDTIDISIVLPCLNEEQTVGVCVRKALQWLSSSGLRGEVIVVDNGSKDRSREFALEAGARVVEEPRRGYGYAHLRGFSEARGRYIVMADSDDTYDLSDLTPLVQPLLNEYDLVIGNRLKGVKPGAMPWLHRFIGTPLFTALLRFFAGTPVGDSQCGLRAFTREAYERMGLRGGGMELASEMILKAARQGLRVAEVPIAYYPRLGESKLRTFRDGWRHLRFLLINTPEFLFLGPGLLFTLVGLFAFSITSLRAAGLHLGPLNWQPLFAGTIFLIIGSNALLLGMASKLYAASRGLVSEDWLVRLYRKHVSLERALVVMGLMIAIGVGIDGYIFQQWVTQGNQAPNLAESASVAQTLIIVGANLALGAFVTALIDSE